MSLMTPATLALPVELPSLLPGHRQELPGATVPTPGTAPGAVKQADLLLGPPQVLFRVDLKDDAKRQHDTLDGETFIVNRNRRASSTTPLTLVLNVDLDAEFQRPVP